MMLEKQPRPGDEAYVQDAPPSYDAALAGAGPSTTRLPPPSPVSPTAPSLSANAIGKRPTSSWWSHFVPSPRAVKEVRITIRGLLRDLVKQADAHGAQGVLDSCDDACRTYDLSLSSLLQEKSIEGHSAVYWAIINRPQAALPGPPRPEEPDFVLAVLSHAAPLSDATVDEIRLACLHSTSDNAFFQRLRRSPAFRPRTGREDIYAGGTVLVDDVDVEESEDDEVAFIARFRIPMFQKRMRISESINLEFIAKSRMWGLTFLVVQEHESRLGYRHHRAGNWVLKLALLSASPPTWIDSRLVIEDPRARTQPQTESSNAPLLPSTSGEKDTSVRASTSASEDRLKPKPPIQLRLKAREQLSVAGASTDSRMIVVELEEDAKANSLQLRGCPYLESDGALEARLEARLVQPNPAAEDECVIC